MLLYIETPPELVQHAAQLQLHHAMEKAASSGTGSSSGESTDKAADTADTAGAAAAASPPSPSPPPPLPPPPALPSALSFPYGRSMVQRNDRYVAALLFAL